MSHRACRTEENNFFTHENFVIDPIQEAKTAIFFAMPDTSRGPTPFETFDFEWAITPSTSIESLQPAFSFDSPVPASYNQLASPEIGRGGPAWLPASRRLDATRWATITRFA